ncbi:MAG: YcxB family protein [Methanocorpusculum sp.]|nr:YcxB family protein [Methanocorpusculum sp.]MDE2522480.1 YcxB family protein [Methanocorpusculum sp.]
MTDITLRYRLGGEDYVAFNEEHTANSPVIQKQLEKNRNGTALAFAVLSFAMMWVWTQNILLSLAFGIVIGLILAFVYPKQMKKSLHTQTWRMFCSEEGDPVREADYILTLPPDALHCTWNKNHLIIDYGNLYKVIESKTHVYLYYDEIQALIVPQHAFSDTNAKKEFFGVLEKRMTAAKNTAS